MYVMANHGNISSVITAETVSGSHVIKIDGYARIKELMEKGEGVSSIPFSVGGYTWIIKYYPNGNCSENADYLSFGVSLISASLKDVKAKFGFKLLDTNGKPVKSVNFISPTHTFNKNSLWGYSKLIGKMRLEGSPYLKDDSFTVQCDLTVMKDVCSKETKGQFEEVAAGDLNQDLGNLLDKKNGADVTFYIGKERLRAHKCILAARSSVFKAWFFGAMSVKNRKTINIEDMEADVFSSLIHFIYTDSLPETSQDVVMAQHLLVAADRYNIERLKLICLEKLSKNINSNMVATTLALAEQHGCIGLKEACFEFLSSPANLEATMASDGFEHLESSCPFVLNGLIARLLPPEMKAARQIAMALRKLRKPWPSDLRWWFLQLNLKMKIDGYSRTNDLIENGKVVLSIPFTVGCHSWTIKYFPNGIYKENKDYLSFYLAVDSSYAKDVKAIFKFSLLDKNGRPVPSYNFTSKICTFKYKGDSWGYQWFIKKNVLEASAYLRDDSFSIQCDVTVMEICRKEAKDKQFVVVSPGNLHQHLIDLLNNMDGTNVTFYVGQERISAHRCILAARSSVLKELFFGATHVKARNNIRIEDMEVDVFRSMLHFIYTDSLPEMSSDDVVMAQHLLVAANRYNVKKLKLTCEEKLLKHIDTNMVAATLALAEQYNSHRLKEACFKFLDSPSNLEMMEASDGYEHLKKNAHLLLPPEMRAAREITLALREGKLLTIRRSQDTTFSFAAAAPISPTLCVAAVPLLSHHLLRADSPPPEMAKHCNIISSAIVAKAVSGSHEIKIDRYSTIKEQIENTKFVSSVPFSVGGYSWIIRYYPNGKDKESEDYLSFFLYNPSIKDVKAIYSFKLLDKDGRPGWHSTTSLLRTFEAYLRHDSFSIRCDVTVMEIDSKETKDKQFVVVPPGNMHQHLGIFLNNMDGTNVTFYVGQETISAHRCILAARSSVFKELFFGATSVKARNNIKIEDMGVDVFKSLLHFIYTDSLPATSSDDVVMAQHILVAANRYNVKKLKLICEEKLLKHIDNNMVATTLALAEKYRCHRLKEACFEFLDSPSNLESMVESDGYEHLKTSCPFVLNEIIARLLPPQMKATREITLAL
uniref:Speckle-type POZ protein n=1 Tax=Leersia perrieri TaxID=77586 RepID=A0A0D9VF92_9ORYZ